MTDYPIPADDATHQAYQERERLVVAARLLYLESGIEAVTKADIAAAAQLDAPAVDRYFPLGKPALVQAMVERYLPYVHQNLEQQLETCNNAVEQLLAMRTFMREEMGQVQTLFFRDLEAHYFASWQYFLRAQQDFLLAYIRTNLRLGMDQQLYRADLDVEFLAQLWLQQITSLLGPAGTGLPPVDAHYELLNRFLAGITTAGGSFVARRLQEGPPYY
ncbi:TetR/AcrR family transcriptional regulator [uncultured Hymenobacter sp.]|uniref:TetR/AcrR family transcriptional regulator n=1 Tax=uncultured Hymenobacter sp. TaxID=170016 RepID=UPI0035C98FBE